MCFFYAGPVVPGSGAVIPVAHLFSFVMDPEGALMVLVRKISALISLALAVGYGSFLSPAGSGQTGTNAKLSRELADLTVAITQRTAPLRPGEKVTAPEGFSLERLPKSVQDAVHAGVMQIDDKGEVQVSIEMTGTTVYGEQLTQLASLGATPKRAVLRAAVPTVEALLPVTMINQAAMLPFVRHIGLPTSVDEYRSATAESLRRSQGAEAAARPGAYQAPKILSEQHVEVSEEARRAKVCGSVMVSLVVGTDGIPSDVKVERSLGYGLDENAVRAVRMWRFQPATKYGMPVAAPISVKVDFQNPVCETTQVKSQSVPVVIKGRSGPVTFLRFSPDGGELARICMFGPVALFDSTHYRKARTFSVGMRMIAYSPDGTRIVTAEGRDGARVWDAKVRGTPTKMSELGVDESYLLDTPLQVLQAHRADTSQQSAVTWAEFSPDGKRLITLHSAGPVKVWNTSSWAVEEEVRLPDATVEAVAFAPDGKTVVLGDASGTLHEWDLARRRWIDTWQSPAGSGVITGVVFSPDGRMLVTTHQTASGSSMAMLWQNNSPTRADGARYAFVEWPGPGGRTWRATGGWIGESQSGFGSAAFSKDGTVLALGGRRIELMHLVRKQIRDVELPEMMWGEIFPGQQSQVDVKQKIPCVVAALSFSPDGGTLAAGCREGTVRLVDSKSVWF